MIGVLAQALRDIGTEGIPVPVSMYAGFDGGGDPGRHFFRRGVAGRPPPDGRDGVRQASHHEGRSRVRRGALFIGFMPGCQELDSSGHVVRFDEGSPARMLAPALAVGVSN